MKRLEISLLKIFAEKRHINEDFLPNSTTDIAVDRSVPKTNRMLYIRLKIMPETGIVQYRAFQRIRSGIKGDLATPS